MNSLVNDDMMRKMLSTEEDMLWLVDQFIDRIIAEEHKKKDFNMYWPEFLRTQFHNNVTRVYRACESPIERYFWSSFQFEFLRRNQLLIVDQRAPYAMMEQRRNIYIGMCEAKTFFNSIPKDARPETFEEFLVVTECPDVKEIADGAICYHDLRWIHCFHLDLQTSLKANNKTIRPDGIVWIPSKPTVKVVIECDGFDYHSDKDAFTKDRQRDRWFSDNGYQIRRYSGSEIHRDPADCTHDLSDYLDSVYITETESKSWNRQLVKNNKPRPSVIEGWRERKQVVTNA